ncbi:MAG: DUF1127 domain-containing protein [Rhodospirillaceae bacterium]|nr:DUF1127 domain-containing protein [Rhodospirillaceae bacterium]MBL6930245.1 DUF1127 domain-containing protein [Rhodospirillales bacterium]MBL6940858.1 DUF1127 domain-containing protein [Rhodospirillales bacterium]
MTAGRAIARLVKSIPWTTDMEAHRFRKAVGELEALSDRMLADIGVERRMIPEVVREIMAAEKQKVAVVKPDTQASSKRKTVPLAANCNEIEKHHHAA